MFFIKTLMVEGLLALALSLLLSPATDVQAAPEKPGYGHGEKLPGDEADNVADRKKILTELYIRLREAEDEPTATIVAAAIEKLWLRSGSDTVDLLMNRAAVLINQADHDVALKILNSIIEIAPAYTEVWNRRAALYFVKKDFSKSLDDLRHALALDPKHFKAIQGLGLLMQELGDKEAALKAFRHALSVHPHLEELRQLEGELAREVEGQGI